ncbi:MULTISPECIES: hypothetical protein [Aequorivita]|uniref:DUF5034 domain-containing protein n=1 Tax=Aequorivita iocasae TaxID=2803865 RepID=A0ABX7DSN0_9FLAO|nr:MULTISPECIES: hypothetical protein [Aequorivita]QQX77160.1 hypothetical protein JK629_02490 [Aequorivita iocasae]UCA56647.1 hypothetical protein LDL78_02510 [Aequorivita sp. F7]
MKNFKNSIKTKVLVIALVVGLPLQMCSPNGSDDCNCGPITGAYFDIQGMEMTQYKKTGEDTFEQMEENELVNYSDYKSLLITYDVDFISQKPKRTKMPSFSFIPSAYACSCRENGDAGSKNEKLTNITVITLNDFDDNHRANDTLNDIMIVEGAYFEEDQYLEDYLVNDTLNVQFPFIRLKVDRKPTLNENYKIRVKVELSTGEVYEKISKSIKIR